MEKTFTKGMINSIFGYTDTDLGGAKMGYPGLSEWVIITYSNGYPEILAHGNGLKRGFKRLGELKSAGKVQDTLYGYKLFIRDKNVIAMEDHCV